MTGKTSWTSQSTI